MYDITCLFVCLFVCFLVCMYTHMYVYSYVCMYIGADYDYYLLGGPAMSWLPRIL